MNIIHTGILLKSIFGFSSSTASPPSSAITYIDAQIPVGAINGVNKSFSLSAIPVPAISLLLYLNGILLRQGIDYTLASSTITYTIAPISGDNHYAYYRA